MSVRFDERTAEGMLRGIARDAELVALARPHVERHLGEPRSFALPIELDGQPAWLKGGPLVGKARLRHALRQRLLRLGLPRMREFTNLQWLRARLFRAPEPLFAGWLETRGSARFQFLVTAAVEGGKPLAACWLDLDADERDAAALELGREVARLHALGFVHRDLHVRNLLLTPPVAGRRIVFLDAWRGGPQWSWRGPAYDLACLSLPCLAHQGEHVFGRSEFGRVLATYLDQGQVLGLRLARLATPAFERALLAERAALVRGIERDPARARGLPPTREWRPPLERG